VNLTTIETLPDAAAMQAAAEVYLSAFSAEPYNEAADEVAAFRQRLVTYAREREGFRLVTVHGDRLDGFALVALARRGAVWRDKVARAVGDDLAARWLGDPCLEVVHVAVRQGCQGQGLGKLLMNEVVRGRPARTGFLSCHPEAPAAQRLYLSQGWTRLAGGVADPAGQVYWIMAKDL
jgi:GNAT superfamily N-acetyltransferase